MRWLAVVGLCGAIGCGGGEAADEATFAGLGEVTLYLNLGDSVGAGYNATGENAPGARGYARLLVDNHAAYPEAPYLRQRFPEIAFVDRAHSGDTSAGLVYQLFDAPESAGDTLVTIYVGGNDFNDDPLTMLNADETAVAIDAWRSNMEIVVADLRDRYASDGRAVRITIATIHEPTDGALSIPAGYEDGFCAMLWQLDALGDGAKQLVWDNYLAFNAAIADFAAAHDLWLVDSHALFEGHGLNADDPWIASDCAHLTDEGHHRLRGAVWSIWEQGG